MTDLIPPRNDAHTPAESLQGGQLSDNAMAQVETLGRPLMGRGDSAAMAAAKENAFHLSEIMAMDQPVVQEDHEFVRKNLRTMLPEYGFGVVDDAIGQLQQQGRLPGAVCMGDYWAPKEIPESQWDASTKYLLDTIPLG